MKRLTRAQAIRAKCLDCCCGSYVEIKECPIKTCSLWRYRMGKEERDHLYYDNKTKSKKATMA